MLPYIIKSLLPAPSFFSITPGPNTTTPGPNSDRFLRLLNLRGCIHVELFVYVHYSLALDSRRDNTPNPSYSLQQRFLVTHIGLREARLPTEHESLALWVKDTETQKMHELVIKRHPSDLSRADRFSAFSRFPESQTVLDTIQKAINNMRCQTSEVEELSSAFSAPNETELLKDLINSTLAKAFAAARSDSETVSPQHSHRDMISWLVPQRFKTEGYIRRFQPLNLSLFDVALLACVVHACSPIYGLFDNQCFMFANIIFESIVQLYSSSSTASIPVPAPRGEGGAPSDANLIFVPTPGLEAKEGRWSGLLITDPIVKKAIVDIVISQFEVSKEEYAL